MLCTSLSDKTREFGGGEVTNPGERYKVLDIIREMYKEIYEEILN
jgi:hypothetical protein